MKDDQRIALTKRLLREGLLRLLSKTDLNKISVTQLCIESGINRATFYRHYEERRFFYALMLRSRGEKSLAICGLFYI